MPSPNDRRDNPTVFVHMITIVVATIQPFLCLSFVYQNDLMQRMPLKWPMMHRTNLDHELAICIQTNVHLQMHWNCVGLIRVYLIVLSLLWLCMLVLLCLNAILNLHHIFDPRILYNLLQSSLMFSRWYWRY